MCDHTVGDRVSDEDGFLGFVRFLGPLDGAPGESISLVGVEWDDPARGKHDGSYKGKRYFTCSRPHTGSFLAPAKLLGGTSFVDALTQRYSAGVGDTSKYQCSGQVPFQQAADGSFPFLRNCACGGIPSLKRIATAGPPGAVKILFPNIVDLSLNECMLTSWAEVFAICAQLAKLSYLNVGANPLGDPIITTDCFPTVHVVKATSTQCTGRAFASLLTIFPNMTELALCHNDMSGGFGLGGCSPHPLECLRLNFANIASWDTIGTSLPLQTTSLHLSDNPIAEVPPTEGGFPSLKQLYMRNTMISSFTSLENLNTFPALVDVAITNTPVLNAAGLTDKECRLVVIAHVAKATTVNGGAVTAQERETAERFLVRHYHDRDEGHEQRPPCYERLHGRHGSLKPLVEINLAPDIELTLLLRMADARGCRPDTIIPRLHELPVVFETPVTVDTRWTRADLARHIQTASGMTLRNSSKIFVWDNELAAVPGARDQLMHVKKVGGEKKLWQVRVQHGDVLYLIE